MVDERARLKKSGLGGRADVGFKAVCKLRGQGTRKARYQWV